MENFKDMRFVLKESKDRLIDKTSLTDEQKSEAKAFFNKYPSYEKEIDWNKVKSLTWDDFKKVIYRDRSKDSKNQVKKAIRKGLEGFTEGVDFDVLYEGNFKGHPFTVYQPYCWEASRMIASNSVPPTDTVGEWCTAYQKENSYWKSHTYAEDNSVFAYVCGESIPTKKVALEINDHLETNCDGMDFEFVIEYTNIRFNIWDKEDNCLDAWDVDDAFFDTITSIGVIEDALANIGKIRNDSISIDPNTGLVTYNDDLTVTEAMVTNGKLNVNYHIVKGYMYVGELDINTLEGFPVEVGGELTLFSLPNLTSLVGAPQKVRSLRITACHALKDFTGCPQVDERIMLSRLDVTSFKGLPKVINGTFDANVLDGVTSLEGVPVEAWAVKLTTLRRLTSLNGLPKATTYKFTSLDGISSFEGLPSEVSEIDFVHLKNIKSLNGLPQTITSCAYLSDIGQIQTLEGAPESVKYDFTVCDCDNLVSTKGAPKFVGRTLDLSSNPMLQTAEELPSGITELNLCHDIKLTQICEIPSTVQTLFVAYCRSLESLGCLTHDLDALDITQTNGAVLKEMLENSKGISIGKMYTDECVMEVKPNMGELYKKYTPLVINSFKMLFPNEEPTVEKLDKTYIGHGNMRDIVRNLIRNGEKVILNRGTLDTAVAEAQLIIYDANNLSEEDFSKKWGMTREDFLTGNYDTDGLEFKAWALIDKTYGDYITEELLDSNLKDAVEYYEVLDRMNVVFANQCYFKTR